MDVQFTSITNVHDPVLIQSYLQRGGTLEAAVTMFFSEGGSGGGGGAMDMDDMDAATRAAIQHAMFSEDQVSHSTAVGKVGEVVREYRSASGQCIQVVHGDLTVEGHSAAAVEDDASAAGGAASAASASAAAAPSAGVASAPGLFVIVNPANKMLDHAGGLAAQLVKKGGPTIDDESRAFLLANGVMNPHGHKIIIDGHVATTTAGRLPSDAIIHAVGPTWNGGAQVMDNPMAIVLQSAVRNCLTTAQSMGAAVVSIPAISTGKFGFPKKLCAEIMVRETVAFFAAGTAGVLSSVRLCNFDRHTVDAFVEMCDDPATATLLVANGWSSVAVAVAVDVATADVGTDAAPFDGDAMVLDAAAAAPDAGAASKLPDTGAAAGAAAAAAPSSGYPAVPTAVASAAPPVAVFEFDNSSNPGRDAPVWQPYDPASSALIDAAFRAGQGSWNGIVSGRFQITVIFDAVTGRHRQQTTRGTRDVRRRAGGGVAAAPVAAHGVVPAVAAPAIPTVAVIGASPPSPAAPATAGGVWEFDNSPTADGSGPFQAYDAASNVAIEAAYLSGSPQWSGIVGGRFQIGISFTEMKQFTARGQRFVRRVGGSGAAPAMAIAAPAPIVAAPPPAAAVGGAGIWSFDSGAAADGSGPYQPYDAASCAAIEAAYQLWQTGAGPGGWQGIVSGRFQVSVEFARMRQVTSRGARFVQRT